MFFVALILLVLVVALLFCGFVALSLTFIALTLTLVSLTMVYLAFLGLLGLLLLGLGLPSLGLRPLDLGVFLPILVFFPSVPVLFNLIVMHAFGLPSLAPPLMVLVVMSPTLGHPSIERRFA